MGGGFGFGMLADVQMLGFYQAQHPHTHKHFLAYVLQVATTTSHFLIYRCVFREEDLAFLLLLLLFFRIETRGMQID